MKNFCSFFFLFVVFSCEKIQINDCLTSYGTTVSKTMITDNFDSIFIYNEFDITIKQEPTTQITITTGDNLINNITLSQEQSGYKIKNEIICKWVRKYQMPKLVISHPNLAKLNVFGSSKIKSIDTLKYNNFTVESINTNAEIEFTIFSDSLFIINNSITNYKINGIVNKLNLKYKSGDGRFDGKKLQIKNLEVIHFGSNDIYINVQDSLQGEINSTGNLIIVEKMPNYIHIALNGRGLLLNEIN